MNNLHKLYYKDYFQGVSFDYLLNGSEGTNNAQITVRNKALTASSYSVKKGQEWKLKDELLIKNEAFPNNDDNKIPLIIQYPGLVTGIGINHETKIKGEFKLGMHFDWTWGMPVIYGSTVKGVLRSSFIAKEEKGEVVEYDDYFLYEVTRHHWEKYEMEALLKDIFYGKTIKKEIGEDGSVTYKEVNKSIYDRDIFFDAVITSPDDKGRILCSDSITPHDDNPLKDPTPLTFLKIAPGCELEFRFKLVDSSIELESGTIKLCKAKKKELFKLVLTTLGIGAKTNVGYGQLRENSPETGASTKVESSMGTTSVYSEIDNTSYDSDSLMTSEEPDRKRTITKTKECIGILSLIKGVGYTVRLEDDEYSNEPYDLKFKQESDKNKLNKKAKRVKVIVTSNNKKVKSVYFKESIL